MTRTRRPRAALAARIARALYGRGVTLEWVPSDEADVFRLTFQSRRQPRFLKIPAPGIGAVWREVAMLPALRARRFPVLRFEHCSTSFPIGDTPFHVTRAIEHIPGSELARRDPVAARRFAYNLGRTVRRLEQLDPREIPASGSWDRRPHHWWRPQYRSLLRDRRWPAIARHWASRILGVLDTPPTAFGGWLGETLIRPGGSFVMIDLTGAGIHWPAAQAAIAMEGLAGLDRALVEPFLHGYAPRGLDSSALESLRLWSAHASLGWSALTRPSAQRIHAATAAVTRCEMSDDPITWF